MQYTNMKMPTSNTQHRSTQQQEGGCGVVACSSVRVLVSQQFWINYTSYEDRGGGGGAVGRGGIDCIIKDSKWTIQKAISSHGAPLVNY